MATYTFRECRKRLGRLWIIAFAVMFLILVAQSFLGGLGDRAVEAWGWFFANVMPTLSLVAVNMQTDAARSKEPDEEVEPFYYQLSFWVSVGYLALLLLVILGWRITKYEEPADAMAFSTVFIGPLQAFTVSVIAIFFKKAGSAPAGKPA